MDIHDGKNDLSREELEASRIIKETSDRLDKLNNDLKNVLSGKGPEYLYPGYQSNRSMDYKSRQKHRIETEIKAVKEKADRDLDDLVQKSPSDVQLKVHKQVDEWKNPDKTLSERGVEKKDLYQSQDYAARLLADEKDKSSPIEPEKTESAETIASSQSRFLQSLNYNRRNDYTDREPEKEDKSIEIDRDDY